MCDYCKALETRSKALAGRIERTKPWDQYADWIRRGAFQVLLRAIQAHMHVTGHEVDTLDIILALGKKAA